MQDNIDKTRYYDPQNPQSVGIGKIFRDDDCCADKRAKCEESSHEGLSLD